MKGHSTVLVGYLTISINVNCHNQYFVNDNFVFQQHSAPAHGALNTVQLLQRETVNE